MISVIIDSCELCRAALEKVKHWSDVFVMHRRADYDARIVLNCWAVVFVMKFE